MCKHTGTRAVCLLMLKQHNFFPTCSQRLLMTPEYKCSLVLVQLLAEIRDSSRLWKWLWVKQILKDQDQQISKIL